MYTYGGITPDMNLIALAVVVWVVALSVAFGFYIPFLRLDSQLLVRRRRADWPAAEDDLDHAPMVAETPAPSSLAAAQPAVAAELPRPMAPPPATLTPCATPEAFSVLIVDDNPINRQVLELILDSAGMAYASVQNGQEAVEAMGACAFDAVLMDLQMPVMDGFEATRRIRELEGARGGARSAIIVVSANCLDEHVAAGRAAGADTHLAKPVSVTALLGELAACPTANRMAA